MTGKMSGRNVCEIQETYDFSCIFSPNKHQRINVLPISDLLICDTSTIFCCLPLCGGMSYNICGMDLTHVFMFPYFFRAPAMAGVLFFEFEFKFIFGVWPILFQFLYF